MAGPLRPHPLPPPLEARPLREVFFSASLSDRINKKASQEPGTSLKWDYADRSVLNMYYVDLRT